MAAKTISIINKINPQVPTMYLLADDLGDIIGYQHPNGQITIIPAGTCDNALTASVTQTQAGGLPLNYRNSRITTVGTAADAVTLPIGIPGMRMVVTNNAAANSMGVFPGLGDKINALATDAVYALAAAKSAEFVCIVAGQWITVPIVAS